MSNYALFTRSFGTTAAPVIDSERGVIPGVAVITEGPALGHTDYDSGLPIYADATTLSEVLKCASQFEGGLKVKMTHGGDAADIVGVLRNFRIDGPTLRADLYALKTTPHRAYIFEIAETVPHAFGLSIAFSGERQVVDDRAMARCAEIYSADLVSEPAANPNGLFTARPVKPDAPQNNRNHLSKMDPEKINESLAALSEQIEAMGARLSKLESPDEPEKLMEGEDEEQAAPAPEKEDELAEGEKEEIAEMAAKAALKLFTKQFGVPGNPAPSHQANNPTTQKKTFESLVADQVAAGKTKIEAIRFCTKNHKAEHQAYEERVRSGEIITL